MAETLVACQTRSRADGPALAGNVAKGGLKCRRSSFHLACCWRDSLSA